MPGGAELEQAVELRAVERLALGRALHLHEAPAARHDDVEVDLGARVLVVVEVEHRLALDDAAGDRGHARRERQLGQLARVDEGAERAVQRDVAAADRGAARAAVGLQDVAVDPHRALAERLEVDDRAQRAADQPLDLDRAAVGAAARGVALLALARRGGQHPVLGADPAAPGAAQPARRVASTLAVQITRVRPIENSTEPSAVSTKPGSRSSGRSSSSARPSCRIAGV